MYINELYNVPRWRGIKGEEAFLDSSPPPNPRQRGTLEKIVFLDS